MFARATQIVRKRKDFSPMRFVQYLKQNPPAGEHYDELKRLVDEESKKIGTTQDIVHGRMWDYFHQSDDWLHEDYWK